MHKVVAVAERVAQACAALGALVFLTSGVVYLYVGRWTVTKAVYWRIYDFCLIHTWLESALHKHFEHSLFFPSFFWLADLQFFHGRQLPLFIAGLALLFLSVALLLIPVWRDKTVSLTAKVIATFVVIAGSFWTARSHITASGGFNVICSLVMVGALVAILALPKMCANSARMWSVTVVVVSAAFVASFSFGAGLAIWPTLLFLIWSLRLQWRSFVAVGIAAVVAVIIYQQLPPRSEDYRVIQAVASTGPSLVPMLCRLAGGPFFYAAASWHAGPFSAEAAQSSVLSLWCGGAGVAIAVVAIVLTMIRRDLTKSSFKFIGMALLTFNFVAMALAVAVNRVRGPGFEFEFLSPRYLFWSTLFWTGLLLVAIQRVESEHWLRWPVYLVVLALPILALPEHYRYALPLRTASVADECAALSLVAGVRDERQMIALWLHSDWIYRVAEQLRVRRLDMFADGLQDWIGQAEANLFGGRRKRVKLEGRCAVAALVQGNDGAPAARVTGQAVRSRHIPRIIRWAMIPASWILGEEIKNESRTPKTLVIVDQSGVIRGLARSSPISPFINSVFYLRKAQTNAFVGYIRDYNPQLPYMVRSADDQVLSEEEIPVQGRITEKAAP
jgi:hypothetical protein